MIDPAGIILSPLCLCQDDVVFMKEDLVLCSMLLLPSKVDNERTKTDNQLRVDNKLGKERWREDNKIKQRKRW